MTPEKILLSLGSNIGDKKSYLTTAIDYISETLVRVDKISSIYSSEPVGYKDQDWFYNLCVLGKTSYPPEELILKLKEIESEIGRKSRQRWHQREIDIDIIFYGNKIISTDDLNIPHPEMSKRKFVLLPAQEIAPTWEHPELNKTVSELLENTSDNSLIKKL